MFNETFTYLAMVLSISGNNGAANAGSLCINVPNTTMHSPNSSSLYSSRTAPHSEHLQKVSSMPAFRNSIKGMIQKAINKFCLALFHYLPVINTIFTNSQCTLFQIEICMASLLNYWLQLRLQLRTTPKIWNKKVNVSLKNLE